MAPPISAKKLQQVFQQAGKTNLHLKEYAGYDHSFTDQAHKNHFGGSIFGCNFVDTETLTELISNCKMGKFYQSKGLKSMP